MVKRTFVAECCGRVYTNREAWRTHKENKAEKCQICIHCNTDYHTAQKQRLHIAHERCSVLHKEHIAAKKAKRTTKKANFHDTVTTLVNTLTNKVDKLEHRCTLQGKEIFRLRTRCDKYETLFERIHGDLKHNSKNTRHIGYRCEAITRHFDRTPLKFNDLDERIQDLEVKLDKRRRRTGPSIFDTFVPPPESDGEGVNGPEFVHKGQTLGDIEKELRSEILQTQHRRDTMTNDERKLARHRMDKLEKTLISQKYTWPGGRVYRSSLPDDTKPSHYRPCAKIVEPQPPQVESELTEESKQEESKTPLVVEGDDDYRSIKQTPVPGRIYDLDHRVRVAGGSKTIRQIFTRFANWSQSYAQWRKFLIRYKINDYAMTISQKRELGEAIDILTRWGFGLDEIAEFERLKHMDDPDEWEQYDVATPKDHDFYL
jgi:hypothetical protein